MIRLQVLSIGNNGLEKELFNVWIYLSVVSEFNTKDCTLEKKKFILKAYFTSTIKTNYKEDNHRNQATTVCRNLDTWTHALTLLDTIKSLETGVANVNKLDKLQTGTLTSAGQYPVRFTI